MRRPRMFARLLVGTILAGLLPTAYAQSKDEILQRGISAFESGDFARAEQMFSLLVKQDPSAVNIGYLAMAEATAGDLARAIAHFRRSIELGNYSASVRYNLGIAYLNSHQPEAGIRELRQAVSQDPKYLAARYALGVALVDSGRAAEGIPFLEQARKLSPKQPEIWVNLVRAHFEAGDRTVGVQTVDQAIKSVPGDPRLAVKLAELCLNHQEIQKARYLLENANELMPQQSEIKLLLAKASMLAGEPIEALAVLKSVQPEAGKPGEISLFRGEAEALVGHLDAAEENLSAAVNADPRNERYLEAYAWVEQIRSRHTEALATLSKSHDLNPQSPTIVYRMGLSYFYLGQYDKATKATEEALKFEPRHDPAYLLLGAIKLAQEDFHAAQAAFQRAVALRPDSALFHRELGVAFFKGGNLTEGKKELDQALTLDPKAVAAYYWRARVLASQRKPQEAIADLETVVALQPGYRGAYSELAQLYSEDGQSVKAAWALAKQREIQETPSTDDRFLRDLP